MTIWFSRWSKFAPPSSDARDIRKYSLIFLANLSKCLLWAHTAHRLAVGIGAKKNTVLYSINVQSVRQKFLARWQETKQQTNERENVSPSATWKRTILQKISLTLSCPDALHEATSDKFNPILLWCAAWGTFRPADKFSSILSWCAEWGNYRPSDKFNPILSWCAEWGTFGPSD